MTTALGAKQSTGSGFRVLLALACVVIIVAGLRAASEFFIPVFLGVFLAVLSLPVLNWLIARKVPRPLAIILTIAVDLLILGGIVYIASGVIPEFQEKRVVYAESLRELTSDFSETMDAQLLRFGGFWARDAATDEGVTAVLGDENIPTFKELFNRYWDSNRIVEAIGGIDVVARITSMATKAFFAMIIMIFILAESGRYTLKVRNVIRVGGPNLRRFQSSSKDMQKYLAIKTAASTATGLLAGLACWAFNVDFPVLWGLVAFMFNYVPAIGSIVAGIPPVILALMESGLLIASVVMVCYLVINITIGNFIEPMLLGNRFGISTVVVILSVMVWGFIWGPVGMFLAVPLTMMVKVMLDNSSDLRWISVLMGKESKELPKLKSRTERSSPEGDLIEGTVES